MLPLISLFALLPAFIAGNPVFKRSSGTCAGGPSPIDNSAASNYAVSMDQTDPGICKGFLDNLHGQCGLGITSYNCNASPTGQMNVTFVAPTTCQGSSIQNAIYLASKPNINGVGCGWYPPDGPGGSEGLATALDAVFEGAAAVFGGES